MDWNGGERGNCGARDRTSVRCINLRPVGWSRGERIAREVGLNTDGASSTVATTGDRTGGLGRNVTQGSVPAVGSLRAADAMAYVSGAITYNKRRNANQTRVLYDRVGLLGMHIYQMMRNGWGNQRNIIWLCDDLFRIT